MEGCLLRRACWSLDLVPCGRCMRRYAVVCDLRAYAGATEMELPACGRHGGTAGTREVRLCVAQGARTAAAVAVCAVGRSANAKLNVIMANRTAGRVRQPRAEQRAKRARACDVRALVACRHARRGVVRRGPPGRRAARIMWRGNREPAFVSCVPGMPARCSAHRSWYWFTLR